MKQKKPIKQQTSWEPVEKWYRGIVGDEGHYYHQKTIIPGVLRLLNLSKDSKLLDLACGNGILARNIPQELTYHGIDIAPSFIKEALGKDRSKTHQYSVGDATKPLPLKDEKFTHSAIILALQNIEFPLLAFKNVYRYLEKGGKFVIVLNHPCFRIPRQTSWQIDEPKKLQYRRVDRYMNAMAIPIMAHPSKGEHSPGTVSFHHPISQYIQWLKEAGFVLVDMEEWCSDKVSTGSASKMENRSREEFPLFLTLLARKL